MNGITSKQWLPIIMIGTFSEPPTLKELAKKCGITHQSTKQLIDKLVEKDFVIITPDKKDKHAMRISLTDKCKQWVIENADENIEKIYQFFADLSEEEIEMFTNIQFKLIKKLQLMEKEYKDNE